MLVLKRKLHEGVVIRDRETGDEMRIVIVETRGSGGGVRIGFNAPDKYEIIREELLCGWRGGNKPTE